MHVHCISVVKNVTFILYAQNFNTAFKFHHILHKQYINWIWIEIHGLMFYLVSLLHLN